MKSHRRTILKAIVIGAVIILVLAVFVGYMVGEYLLVYGFVRSGGGEMRRMRVRLLCETDHEVLLEACNELSRLAKRGDLKPGTYYIRRSSDSQVSKFPLPILVLQPSCVYIDENDSGRVMLEMMGGLDHFGVEAYTEDYKKPPVAGFTFGDRELIPRLWYYDDGYIGHPEYDRRIEQLIQKGKAKQ